MRPDESRHRFDPAPEVTGRCQPRRAVERDVLGGDPRLERAHPRVQETEGLDDVAHGLVEVGLLGLGPGGAARPQAAEATGPSPSGASVVGPATQYVGQVGGPGLVRPETVAQERERAHEVPLVASLGGETGERGAQGLAGAALVVGGHVDGCHGRTPRPTSADIVAVSCGGVVGLGPAGRGARSGHGG